MSYSPYVYAALLNVHSYSKNDESWDDTFMKLLAISFPVEPKLLSIGSNFTNNISSNFIAQRKQESSKQCNYMYFKEKSLINRLFNILSTDDLFDIKNPKIIEKLSTHKWNILCLNTENDFRIYKCIQKYIDYYHIIITHSDTNLKSHINSYLDKSKREYDYFEHRPISNLTIFVVDLPIQFNEKPLLKLLNIYNNEQLDSLLQLGSKNIASKQEVINIITNKYTQIYDINHINDIFTSILSQLLVIPPLKKNINYDSDYDDNIEYDVTYLNKILEKCL